MEKLLTRDEFREAVFKRDGYKCVICKAPAVDAHHVVERRLFTDSGYYVSNGASVCSECHLRAESTELSCDEIRNAAGITEIILPEHLYRDNEYDKWGNIILPNGQRLKGELFDDESVQKIIKPVLHLFTTYVKYPRTFHLPWSDKVGKDDRIVPNDLINKLNIERPEIVVTEKKDGENSSLYNNYLHARSLEYSPHPSRDWLKAFHASIAYNIPDNFRLCGENLWAKHSIYYQNLSAYFLCFSIWNDKNVCLSWDDTIEWAELIGVELVPVLYRGPWDEGLLKSLYKPYYNNDPCEGYVVRLASDFNYRQFRNSVFKFVSNTFEITSHHWKFQQVVQNKLMVKT